MFDEFMEGVGVITSDSLGTTASSQLLEIWKKSYTGAVVSASFLMFFQCSFKFLVANCFG